MGGLFAASEESLRQSLAEVIKAVSGVFPQKKTHREDLPYAVRDLSRLLTTERARKNGYWASPRLAGAYLHYFLPWNMLRLSRLLPCLPLNIQPEDKIVDLGSGPLTLPLSLWLCGPRERRLPLTWFCADSAPHPLELGRNIFGRLAALPGPERTLTEESAPERTIPAPWRLNLLRAPLESALRKVGVKANLITAMNVLNELPAPRQETMEERLGRLFASMDRALAPGGQILLVEPGTRLGGKIVQLMRMAALARGFEAVAPCTHDAPCPFLAGIRSGRNKFSGEVLPENPPSGVKGGNVAGQHASGAWCHFGYASAGAPEELLELSAQAGLTKERVYLSFVLLRKNLAESGPGRRRFGGAEPARQERGREAFPARVVSELIRLPEYGGAYYACTREGLGLLPGGGKISAGSEILVRRAVKGGRDPKSGAIFLEPASASGAYL
jgi:SAM-dependent methyltransferase